jgi:hypothetical protein
MANVSIVKIKVRRGTDAQRRQIVLDQGELGFTTDYSRLFVGDGSTLGGICPAIKFYTINSSTENTISQTAAPVQLNDLVYDIYTTNFYVLSATPNTLLSNYQFLPIVTLKNAGSIVPTASANLTSGSLWINATVNPKTLNVI